MLPLFLVVTKSCLDRLLVDFLQIIQTVGQDDCVLHRTDGTLSCTWKHLSETKNRPHVSVMKMTEIAKLWREERENIVSTIRSEYLVSSIADEGSSAIVPSRKELVFKVHTRNGVLGGLINQITHGAEGGLEIPDLIHHVAALLRSPLAVAELFVLALGHGGELTNNGIANTVAWHVKEDPL